MRERVDAASTRGCQASNPMLGLSLAFWTRVNRHRVFHGLPRGVLTNRFPSSSEFVAMPAVDTLTIEQAEPADLPRLSELLGELFSMEEEFKPDLEKQERGLRRIIEEPKLGRIFVARIDGRIAGMVNLLFTISTAEGGRAALLEDMVVGAGFRGRGTGSSLIRHAIEFARTEGCLRITLLTDAGNEKAIEFYQKRGFTTSPMIPMRLKL